MAMTSFRYSFGFTLCGLQRADNRHIDRHLMVVAEEIILPSSCTSRPWCFRKAFHSNMLALLYLTVEREVVFILLKPHFGK